MLEKLAKALNVGKSTISDHLYVNNHLYVKDLKKKRNMDST